MVDFNRGDSAAAPMVRGPLTSAGVGFRPSHSVVLIGLMGAGKTSIGRRLAQRLGLAFVDSDHEIETAAGCTIETIFEMYGERAFRDCERRVIGRLLEEPVQIIATGGGAFMDAETRATVKSRGLSVWLRADLDLLLHRVARRANRPLLKRGDPREILAGLIAERHPVYAEADATVDTRDAPPDVTVDAVIEAVQRLDRATEPAAATMA
ncbi:MAG: shikimate kinase [Alphaproteobacteria bacterium]|nr:shikimate kinase [Alphaproteobacteria bacterium]